MQITMTMTPCTVVLLQLPDLDNNLYFGIYFIKPALRYLPGSAADAKQGISREFLQNVRGIKLKGEKLLKNKLSWAIWTIQ